MALIKQARPARTGLTYYTGTSSTGWVLDVVRVDTRAVGPFVLGSTLGSAFGGSTNPGSRREAISLQSLNNKRELNKPLIVRIGSVNRILSPYWLSNGAFFGKDPAGETDGSFAYVLGPIVSSRGSGPSKTIADFESSVPIYKRERWYYAQVDQRPSFHKNVGGVSATRLAVTYGSVIGGAGCLIENGRLNNLRYWMSKAGGAFDEPGNNQTFHVGPIIACNSNSRVLYLIMARFGSSPKYVPWSRMAPYLHNPELFLKEIGCRGDGRILYALVYDGGGSPQLWVKGRGAGGRGIISGYTVRPVPHRIGLWAS